MGFETESAPKRAFLPQPFEVSSRSSKPSTLDQQPSKPNDDSNKLHNNTTPADHNDGGASRSAVDQHIPDQFPASVLQPQLSAEIQSAETGVSDSGEASTKRSRSVQAAEPTDASPKRRFLPQPIDSTTRSSRSSKSSEVDRNKPGADAAKTTRRIVPQLVETTTERCGRRIHENGSGKQGNNLDVENKAVKPEPNSQSKPKKFLPQLLETEKRSFRQSATPRNAIPIPKPRVTSVDEQESRFSYANLLRRQQSRQQGKPSSFRVPDLPVIPSNSSECSEKSPLPSLSTSPTLSDESSKPHQRGDQCRESCDEQYANYLLSLAARSAEDQLKEQALAAFPNEQVYQSVSHFAIDREDTDNDAERMELALRDMQMNIPLCRRESSVNLGWELEEMRRHKEESEMRARERMFNANANQSRFSAAAIATRQAAENKEIERWQNKLPKEQQKALTSPPMLGSDIVFPQSISPKSTKCETDHFPVPRRDSGGEPVEEENDCALWTAGLHVENCGDGGLWKGTCNKSDQSPCKIPRLGIITPAIDPKTGMFANLNGIAAASIPSQLPTTPPDSEDPNIENMDRLLRREEEIKREFHDGFVTQIYNYLSLGYPCVARDFDAELSKISHISLEELRKDDHHANAKGYVGAPEGDGVSEDGVAGGKCVRWTALKQYILEWARQQPIIQGVDADVVKDWGATARRGSWAV
ncbi:hypothetical protein AJ80_06980 [Polytolypa hystricis UAMH7299]|uniref:Uncharacterized protein n=1 Tax=Polytolypa hystricis (strain UAMH7299) TaxID=1447883 RepID=A0A2B7XT48_POLH7|nr:hypothetical protein AJ80_06980 [Polytolypa hystricis UAMH7299]